MENGNGLVVNTRVTQATGTAEREAALEMAVEIPGDRRRVTLGADKNYDTRESTSTSNGDDASEERLCEQPDRR
jgi:hypothetical protein